MQKEVDDLIHRRYDKREASKSGRRTPLPPPPIRANKDSGPPLRTVDVVSGGRSLAGDSMSARKRHARAVYTAAVGNKRPPRSGVVLGFSDDDVREDVVYPHDDPLVITLQVNQVLLKRTLIDTVAQVNLITLEPLRRMGVDPKHIRPIRSTLTGFSQT